MCGRYAFDDIEEIYEVRTFLEEAAVNVGGETAAKIKTGEVFPSETAAVFAERLGATAMSWGYPMHGTKRIIINARRETVFEKPMFRKGILNSRCLIPCTGFYEWKRENGVKQKYKIKPVGESFFYLAGLFSEFHTSNSKEKKFVIITSPANNSMKDIHDRMPIIISKQNADVWLKNGADEIDSLYKKIANLEKTAV